MTTISVFRGEHDFLSNFYHAPFTFLGYEINTVENGFQAFKTLDEVSRMSILTGSPGHAKRLGRRVPLRSGWDEMKNSLMYLLVMAKFTQNRTLADKLVGTGRATIIEGNTWNDKYWGAVFDDGRWVGYNHLGCILMDVRSELHLISTLGSGDL